DAVNGATYLHEIYTRADPYYTGRATVPALWDKERGMIVNNESAELLRMFNSGFGALAEEPPDLYSVAIEMAWIDRTSLEVPVDWDPILRGKSLRDLGPQRIEDCVFRFQVPGPIRGIEFLCVELMRHIGVPRLERGSTLRIPRANAKQRHEDGGEQDRKSTRL